MKKQVVNLSDGEDARWNDVSARWDALVGNGDAGESDGTMVDGHRHSSIPWPVDDDDGIAWQRMPMALEFEKYKLRDAGAFKRVSRILEEVGPIGELLDYTLAAAIANAPVDRYRWSRQRRRTLQPEPDRDGRPFTAEEKPSLYTTTIPETSMLSFDIDCDTHSFDDSTGRYRRRERSRGVRDGFLERQPGRLVDLRYRPRISRARTGAQSRFDACAGQRVVVLCSIFVSSILHCSVDAY